MYYIINYNIMKKKINSFSIFIKINFWNKLKMQNRYQNFLRKLRIFGDINNVNNNNITIQNNRNMINNNTIKFNLLISKFLL